MINSTFVNEKEKRFSFIIFGIYLVLLFWLVLFKFATSLDTIPHMRGLNLIPFCYDMENTVQMREVVLNIIVFIPAGFFFSAFSPRYRALYSILLTLFLSLFFEAVQWVFSIGASDIADVIGNTTGGAIDALLFLFMGIITTRYRMKIINIIGLITEALAFVFLTTLLLAN